MGLLSKPKLAAVTQPQQPPPPPPPSAPISPFFGPTLASRGLGTFNALGGTIKTLGKPLLKVPSRSILQNIPNSLGKPLGPLQ